jgi:hypothetical protein
LSLRNGDTGDQTMTTIAHRAALPTLTRSNVSSGLISSVCFDATDDTVTVITMGPMHHSEVLMTSAEARAVWTGRLAQGFARTN